MTNVDTSATDDGRRLRRGVYGMLIALAVGDATGRLLAVDSVNRADAQQRAINLRIDSLRSQLAEQGLDEAAIDERIAAERPQLEREEQLMRPFLSSNDRSRWLAIRALAERGTFEIDELLDRRRWNTIDMVQHRGRDGELHLYSSKPPLSYVPTAGLYWLVKSATGMTLAERPHTVGRLILLFVNVLPLAVMIAVVAALAERFGKTDWGRIFVVAVAALATMLKPFVVVLNNHLPAAVAAAMTLYAVARILADGDHRKRWYALAGLAAAFTASNELPALSLLAVVGAALAWHNWRATAVAFAPCVLAVAAAFFGSNYIAHASWRPPYAHRSETDPEDNWYAYSYEVEGRTIESYWLNPQGVDRGEPSKAVYAFHVLFGHHGVFSLTPAWLLAAAGLVMWVRRDDRFGRWGAAGILLISAVCLAFYINRPLEDRNYGGMTSGFRWMFWFAPLWLWGMLPAADRASRSRIGRGLALMLLVVSTLSASYPTWNPWISPWLRAWFTDP